MARSILIVDDEEQVRHVLRLKLERCGYDVCEATGGDEAIRFLRTVPFDLVITDIVMPDKDGLETIVFIRKEQPDVKVIAISAPSNRLYLEDARGLGATHAFEKPLNLAKLAQTVKDLLGE